jgi:hypothetical protein
MEYLWRLNKRTFDRTEELECAPNVPCENEILRQLDKLSFRDESASKKKKSGRKVKQLLMII